MLKKIYSAIHNSPLLSALVKIVLTVIVILVAAHYLMQLGTRHGARCQVPDFTGVTIGDAMHMAKKHKLEIIVNDSLYVPVYDGGIVLEQNPKPQVDVKPGRKVYVTINSFAQRKVAVPYVTGYSLRQAKNNLEVAGLEIAELIYRPDMATNYVLEERFHDRVISKNDNLEIEAGSGITLVVGIAPEEAAVSVPKVIGFPLKEAKSRLWEVGLNVGNVDFDKEIGVLDRKDARVYFQSPGQNKILTLGQRVDLRLTLDHDKIDKESSLSDRKARQAEAENQLRRTQITDSLMVIEAARKQAELAEQDAQPESDQLSDSPTTTDDEETFFD